MKMRITFRMMLGILGMLTMLAFGGCGSNANQDDWLHGGVIPREIAYEGNTFQSTGETVATIKIVPDNFDFIGHGTLVGSPSLIPTEQCNPEPGYEVYSIEGIDEHEAIAVKFLLVGQSGAYYVFYKYQRQ